MIARQVLRAALLAATLIAGPVALPPAASAQVLVSNVRGETIAADGAVERLSGLLTDASGTIVAVYHPGDRLPRKGFHYHLDGHGAVLLPGMIDAHVHVMATGYAALTLDLSDTTTLAGALDKIRAYAAQYPNRPWIIGQGWNQERWGIGRFPTAADLDTVVANRPVWLDRVDGHAGWANSAALAAAGVVATTPDPAGGRIERTGDGRPAGVLVDTAHDIIDRVVPKPGARDDDLALQLAQRQFFQRGLTSVADMGTDVRDWMTFRRAGDANRLFVRIMAYALGVDAMAAIGGPAPTPWLYGDRLHLGGVKFFLDGALGSRGAWLKAPYADVPATTAKGGTRGLPQMTDVQLGNLMSRAAMDGFQVAVHAIGDQANATLLATIEDLTQTYHGDRRWRIEHAQIVDPADWPRVRQIADHGGIIASMQPVHQTSDRLMAEARLGPDRLSGAYAWASLRGKGAILAFGSDSPIERPDPWAGLAVAISREDETGQPAGGWQPQEKIDRATALAGYTSNAAYAGFAENRFGRLTPGLRADFILVDTDPMTATPAEIRKTRVLQTWLGGGKVWDSEHPEEGAVKK